MRFPNSTYFK